MLSSVPPSPRRAWLINRTFPMSRPLGSTPTPSQQGLLSYYGPVRPRAPRRYSPRQRFCPALAASGTRTRFRSPLDHRRSARRRRPGPLGHGRAIARGSEDGKPPSDADPGNPPGRPRDAQPARLPAGMAGGWSHGQLQLAGSRHRGRGRRSYPASPYLSLAKITGQARRWLHGGGADGDLVRAAAEMLPGERLGSAHRPGLAAALDPGQPGYSALGRPPGGVVSPRGPFRCCRQGPWGGR